MKNLLDWIKPPCAALFATTLIVINTAVVLSGCGGGGDAAPVVQTLHVISYGQSLSLGERSEIGWPNDLTLPNDYVQVGSMFSDGIRSLGTAALVPYAESTAPVDGSVWNIGTPGETPVYGALLALKDLPGKRIGSAAGRGGTRIADLEKGSVPYARLLAQVSDAKAIVGDGYSVALIWMQGESDAGSTTYAAQLEQLVTDLGADIKAIDSQPTLQVYICEVANDIGPQQEQVAAAMPNVHIACHCADYPKSDGTHLTQAGSRAAGLALGAAMR